MFSAYCPDHEAIVLFSTTHLVSLHRTAQGLQAEVACYCGARFTTTLASAAPGSDAIPTQAA